MSTYDREDVGADDAYCGGLESQDEHTHYVAAMTRAMGTGRQEAVCGAPVVAYSSDPTCPACQAWLAGPLDSNGRVPPPMPIPTQAQADACPGYLKPGATIGRPTLPTSAQLDADRQREALIQRNTQRIKASPEYLAQTAQAIHVASGDLLDIALHLTDAMTALQVQAIAEGLRARLDAVIDLSQQKAAELSKETPCPF